MDLKELISLWAGVTGLLTESLQEPQEEMKLREVSLPQVIRPVNGKDCLNLGLFGSKFPIML